MMSAQLACFLCGGFELGLVVGLDPDGRRLALSICRCGGYSPVLMSSKMAAANLVALQTDGCQIIGPDEDPRKAVTG